MTARLDRVGQGLFEALNDASVAAVVAWAYGEQPRVEGDLLSLRLTGGPAPRHRHHARGDLLLPASSVTITVTGVTVGSRLIMRLNGFDYRHDVTGIDTVTTIRDGFLAQIQAGEADFMTATSSGADGITLTAGFLGALRSLFLVGSDLTDGGSAVFSGNAVLVTTGTVGLTLQMQAFSKGHELRNGAWSIVDTAIERLQRESVSRELHRYGVALGAKGPVVNLSAIAGGNWSSRCAADVAVFARHVGVEPVDQIETVNVNVTADPGGNLVAATATAP